MAPLSFGLNLSQKAADRKTLSSSAFAFGVDDESEDDNDAAIEIGSFDQEEQPQSAKNARSLKPDAPLGSSTKRPSGLDESSDFSLSSKLRHDAVQAAAQDYDSSVFDYDTHYGTTSSAAADARKRATAKAEAQTRTPKYVQNMATAAAVREKDQLRARDKVLQKEREAEGEEFADKEVFVTTAYKDQQAAARRAEEEEAKREEAEAKSGKAMQNFWRGMMKETMARHEKETADGSQSFEAIDTDVQKTAEQEALEKARELNAQGASIQINVEGQVADKRQLLAAGLNVVAKNGTVATTSTADKSRVSAESSSRATDRGAAKDAMRQRQSRMLAQQLEASQKRRADEEAEEASKRQRAAKSQKTEGEISSARERFLARKREAAAAKARGEAP